MAWSFGGGPKTCLAVLAGRWVFAANGAYGKHDGDSSADRLGPVQMGFLAQEELFFAVGEFPRGDGCPVEVDGDGFAAGESGFDGVFVEGDGGLGEGRADTDGGGFAGAIHGDGRLLRIED